MSLLYAGDLIAVPNTYSQDHKTRGKGGPQNILTIIKNQQLRSKILFV